MSRGYTNFVDPQLRRFVRMYVMHARGKSDDLALIERDRQVVSVVTQELGHKPWVHVMIENTRCHVVENRLVPRKKNLDVRSHALVLSEVTSECGFR
jgi:hypothetical protein